MRALIYNYIEKTKHYYNKVAFRPYEITKTIAGQSYRFYIGDPVAKSWYDKEDDAWQEMEYLKDTILRSGDVVLECGAHHGFTTCHIARTVGPKGKVIAFEPSPSNCAIIRKNLKLNGLTNVKVVNKAISDKAGFANFSFVSNGSIQKRALASYKVEVTTIDAYKNEKPTVLKIDVEGYDIEALKGAEAVLATKPKLALEIHYSSLPALGHKVDEIFKLIDTSKYQCTVLDEGKIIPYTTPADIHNNVHLFAVPTKSHAAPKPRS